MRHSHLEIGDLGITISSFEQGTFLADLAKPSPHGTMLVMLLHADETICDILSFAKGDRSPLETVQFVCSYRHEDDTSLLLASCRGQGSPLLRQELDLREWRAMSTAAAAAGVRLLDWFIVGGGLMFVPSELSEVSGGW